MIELPTPETDAFAIKFKTTCGEKYWVPVDIARKLERERDEAHKELSSIHRWIERNHADGFIDSLTYLQNLERVTDSWYDRIDAIETDARRFVRERDEAREKLRMANIESNARQEIASALKERDEARKETEYYKKRYEQLKDGREMSDRKWYNGREIPADIKEEAK